MNAHWNAVSRRRREPAGSPAEWRRLAFWADLSSVFREGFKEGDYLRVEVLFQTIEDTW